MQCFCVSQVQSVRFPGSTVDPPFPNKNARCPKGRLTLAHVVGVYNANEKRRDTIVLLGGLVIYFRRTNLKSPQINSPTKINLLKRTVSLQEIKCPEIVLLPKYPLCRDSTIYTFITLVLCLSYNHFKHYTKLYTVIQALMSGNRARVIGYSI